MGYKPLIVAGLAAGLLGYSHNAHSASESASVGEFTQLLEQYQDTIDRVREYVDELKSLRRRRNDFSIWDEKTTSPRWYAMGKIDTGGGWKGRERVHPIHKITFTPDESGLLKEEKKLFFSMEHHSMGLRYYIRFDPDKPVLEISEVESVKGGGNTAYREIVDCGANGFPPRAPLQLDLGDRIQGCWERFVYDPLNGKKVDLDLSPGRLETSDETVRDNRQKAHTTLLGMIGNLQPLVHSSLLEAETRERDIHEMLMQAREKALVEGQEKVNKNEAEFWGPSYKPQ